MPESQREHFIGTVHRAGPLVDRVQKCLDCGGILCNYVNAMVQVGHDMPGGWEEGADVTYWGALEGSNQSAVGIHQPAIRCKQAVA